MYGSDPENIATYARKLTEIQIPGMKYNTVPLARGGRTDILGESEGLVESPYTGAGATPGVVYGTEYDETIPLNTRGEGGISDVPYTISGSGTSSENVWEIGTAESYCMYPDQIMPKN